jgi:hypothetical protein
MYIILKKIRKYSRFTLFFQFFFFKQTKPAKIKYSRDDLLHGGSLFFIFLLILMGSVWIPVHVGLQVCNKSDRLHELTRSSSICSVCPLSPRQVIEGFARGYFLFFLRQDCSTQLIFSETRRPHWCMGSDVVLIAICKWWEGTWDLFQLG